MTCRAIFIKPLRRVAAADLRRGHSEAKRIAQAMTRLANQNLADADPPRWVEVMLYSHPAISRRVAAAHAFEAGTGGAASPE